MSASALDAAGPPRLTLDPMDILYPYGGALVAPFAAMYVASILCRIQIGKGKRPGWLAGLVSLLFAILVALFCSFQFDVFRPWRWSIVGGKTDLQVLIVFTAFLAFLVSVVPASFVVDRYQKRYDRTHSHV